MPMVLPINLLVEDDLSEVILREILRQSNRHFIVGPCHGKKGSGYIKKNIFGFNHAAKGIPYCVLTDLDEAACAPSLIKDWLPGSKHSNLIFRIAIREVEAWILAHKDAFASFLGIKKELIPRDADSIPDPKQFLVNLARRSRYRQLREAIVPGQNTTAKTGPDYNGVLISFVIRQWKVREAMRNSDSLRRTVKAIAKFKPKWKMKN